MTWPFRICFKASVDLRSLQMRPFYPKGRARHLLDAIISSNNKDGTYTFGSEAKVTILRLLQSLKEMGCAPASRHGRPPGRGLSRAVELAKSFIERNCGRPITLGEVAKVSCAGVYSLCRRFREQEGLSPMAYCRELRMRSARRALLDTDLSVKQVAFGCGFKGQKQFGHAFKEAMGMSPRAFRAHANTAKK
jgi:transcriptional regulator GlxA family with amidase domain